MVQTGTVVSSLILTAPQVSALGTADAALQAPGFPDLASANIAEILQEEKNFVDENHLSEGEDEGHEHDVDHTIREGGECTLYMAPSSIPGAGWGIYTAVDLPIGSPVGEDLFDLVIPIQDKFKTLPYKGQQRVLSWLGYVWPETAGLFDPSGFDDIEPEFPNGKFTIDEGLVAADDVTFHDDDGKQMSVFGPGLASLLNSHETLHNLEKADDTQLKDMISTFNSTLMYPFTPHYGVTFTTTEDVEAGSELFLFYGALWHEDLEEKQYDMEHFTDYRVPRMNISDISTEAEKRNEWDEGRQPTAEVEAKLAMLRLEKNSSLMERELNQKAWHFSAQGASVCSHNSTNAETTSADISEEKGGSTNAETLVDSKEKGTDPDEDTTGEQQEESDQDDDEDEEVVHTKQVSWLEKNGVCLDDKLEFGYSNIHFAGRGVFAKKWLPKGAVLQVAPLLTLKRDDLTIYKSVNEPGQFRPFLIHNEAVGQEMLLNYCFGHKDSELLLLPYSPLVNYINHNGEEPNAAIQWPAGIEKPWLDQHPLDVLDQSGKLTMEFVALRDIDMEEEITISYQSDWEAAWQLYIAESIGSNQAFRHEIGVPDGFYPTAWLNKPAVYEVAPFEPLQPGELVQPRWVHSNKPLADNIYAIGLPKGFSQYFREYADRLGIHELYETLLLAEKPVLKDNEWYVFNTTTGHDGEWFAHSFENAHFEFNMHYIAAWDAIARESFLSAMGEAGFGHVLESLGRHFGLDFLTCFHASFMGASECENSRRHADVYGTDGKGFNIIFPVVLVDGSRPELDVVTQDPNVEVALKYKEDIAYVLSDFAYHKTATNSYRDNRGVRIVVGTYCAQIDETNHDVIQWIYDGEINAPFRDQFKVLPHPEVHWSRHGGGPFNL